MTVGESSDRPTRPTSRHHCHRSTIEIGLAAGIEVVGIAGRTETDVGRRYYIPCRNSVRKWADSWPNYLSWSVRTLNAETVRSGSPGDPVALPHRGR